MTNSPVPAAPSVDQWGAVYVATEGGDLHRIEFNGHGTVVYSADSPIRTTPALAQPTHSQGDSPMSGGVYLGDDAGRLHGVRLDGQGNWILAPGTPPNQSPIRSAPVARHDNIQLVRVYAGATDGFLHAVFETGAGLASTAWSAMTASPLHSSPALSPQGDMVLAGGPDGALYCLDAFSGAPLLGSPITLAASALMTPVVDDSGVYVVDDAGNLYARNPKLQPRWQLSLGVPVAVTPALGLNGNLLIVAGGQLWAVSTLGEVLWNEPLQGHEGLTAPAADAHGTVYLTSAGGAVLGLRTQPEGGTHVAWQVQLPGSPSATAASIDGRGRLYVAGSDGSVHAVDEAAAFELLLETDPAAATNRDIYSARETYGKIDPARTRRLTSHPARDGQPAWSLHRGVLAFRSDRAQSPDAFLATSIGTSQQNLTPTGAQFPADSVEANPAFTPIDDLTGLPRPPHQRRYLAVTSTRTGPSQLVFVDLADHAAGTVTARSFLDWAAELGVPAAIIAQLEPAETDQSHPAFAPDGSRLAWRQCNPSAGTGQVRLLRLGPTGWTLTTVGPAYSYDPASPDGCLDEPCFAPDSRWLAIRDGSSLAIHDTEGVMASYYSTPPNGALPTHPSWSPDGSQIAVGLRAGTTTTVHVATGPGWASYAPLPLEGATFSDEPSYHFFKAPPPRGLQLHPDREAPGGVIQVHGQGFDILHPENNIVTFAFAGNDPDQTQRQRAVVLRAGVDPPTGLGMLTVVVPNLAGHGTVTVATRYGSTTSPPFQVIPRPTDVVQPRTVPGARIRVFGLGFDLKPATQHMVSFSTVAGGEVSAPVIGGGLLGAPEVRQEFLIVIVPVGTTDATTVADEAKVRVSNAFGSGTWEGQLIRLYPTVQLARTTGLPSYASQGAPGVMVRVDGNNFPHDPFFGLGTTFVNLTADTIPPSAAPSGPVPIGVAAFAAAPSSDPTSPTATLVPTTFVFPALEASHPGGPLTITAADNLLTTIPAGSVRPAATAVTTFRVPLADIPIVFVPGTGGSSLDIAPGVFSPITAETKADLHMFLWLSKTAAQWPADPWGPLAHPPRTFTYNPSVPGVYPPPGPIMDHPGDPRGRRIWASAELVAEMVNSTLTGNHGNHYLDIIGFDPTGAPLRPDVAPGTVLQDIMVNPPPPGSGNWGFREQYKPMVDFLRTPSAATGWPGRPLCTTTSPATGFCVDVNGSPASGRNAVYLFNLDWRQNIPTEAARLATFIDGILSRPDVTTKRVVLITHSYGGPVARAYYLNPANAADSKVDQVISLGGGFLGVVEPMDILEQGSTWGLGIDWVSGGGGLQKWETWALAQNWPTAYFQMPNAEDWFFDHGIPIGGGTTVNRAYVRDGRWPGGAGMLASYAESMTWLASRHNPTLVAAQTAFFNPPSGPPLGLGDFRAGTGAIYHHRIIGKGKLGTIIGTSVRLAPSLRAQSLLPIDPRWIVEMVPTEHWSSVYGDGDETVPYHGALGRTDPADDRVYIVDGAKHSMLTNLPELIGAGSKGLLQLLLEGAICSVAQAPPPFLSQNQVSENFGKPFPVFPQPPANSGEVEAVAARQPDRWLVEARGAVQLDVTDAEGRHLGPHPTVAGLVEEEIPGASYRAGLPDSMAFLIGPDRYRIRLTAQAKTDTRLAVRAYDAEHGYGSLLFRSVTLDEQQVADLLLDTSREWADAPALEVRDGPQDMSRRVRGDLLDPVRALDTIPPQTIIRVKGDLATVVATDDPGGSGLYRTVYTTDGTHTVLYEEPFRVPDDASLVMAYSEDWAGNLEYPGAVLPVLGLSEPAIRLTLNRRGRRPATAPVQVRNLEPFEVTGPLDCQIEATGDCPWLSLEPKSASTPFDLKLTVDGRSLSPGEHTCDVVVTSTTPGTVFAPRVLPITITIQ